MCRNQIVLAGGSGGEGFWDMCGKPDTYVTLALNPRSLEAPGLVLSFRN